LYNINICNNKYSAADAWLNLWTKIRNKLAVRRIVVTFSSEWSILHCRWGADWRGRHW